VLVATSNLAPDRLYEGGLNRALFLPFIETLKAQTEIIELDSRTDYRLEKTAGGAAYLVPADNEAHAALDAIFHELLGDAQAHPTTLTVKGHLVHVPVAGDGVARFSYDDLCKAALGSLDFLEIAKTFSRALVIDNIPIIHSENRNEAKRFIALIDALYDQSVKLYASAAALPQDLYKAESGREAFEFDRTTASRLIEMQSDEYRALPHGERLVGSTVSDFDREKN
jgi:cell division protein ZapE